jgi:hypothetical protein
MKRSVMILALAAMATQAGAQMRRDPFARPAGAVAAPAADSAAAPVPVAPPRLRAVMFEPGKSLVNIDGRILAVGDSFDDYRIAAIGERSATLLRRGLRSVIVLDAESSK